jgi:hypothetical protein
MPEPKVVQAAPGGYLVDLGDGSEPRLFPESTVVEAGLVAPTQGLYAGGGNGLQGVVNQQAQVAGSAESAAPIENVYETDFSQPAPMPGQAPGFGVGQLQAPQVAPPQQSAPQLGNHSAGYSVSTSTPGYISRERAFGPAPASLDLTPQREALAEQAAVYGEGADTQQRALTLKNQAETRADEVTYGKFDPKTGALLQAGGSQMAVEARNEDLEARQQFDAMTAEYVNKRTAEINERIARVPQEDPSRIWHENNAFQNAAGLIAATLGGMLAVSTGSGRNMGMEAIEGAIQRDIMAQRTNIDSEWKKVAHDENSLQQYQQWRGRERQSMLEESAVRLETLAIEVEAKASTFKSVARQAEYLGQAAALRMNAADKVSELIKLEAEFAQAEANSALGRWRALGDAAVQKSQVAQNYAQAAAAKASAAAKGPEANPPIYKFKNGDTMYLDPRYASTMRPEDIEKYRQTAAKKDTFVQGYDELIRDINAMGRKLAIAPGKIGAGSPELKALKDRAMKFALDYTNEKAATTFTDRLLDTVISMSGAPQGLTDVDKTPSMLAFKKSTIDEMDGQFRGRGAFIVSGEVDAATGQPKVSDYDAYAQYGQNPIPAEAGPPGQRLQGALTDIMFGSDPKSQLESLDSILNYATSPVGGGAGNAGIKGLLRNLQVTEVDGKTGLSNRGGGPVLSEEQAIKRLTLQRTRLKALNPDARDRIDDMFDELEGYLRADPGVDTSIGGDVADPRRFGGVK